MSVFILGAGAWGSAIAQAISFGGHEVFLYTRSSDVMNAINDSHKHSNVLKDIELNRNIIAVSDFDCMRKCKYVFLVIPAQSVRDNIEKLRAIINDDVIICICSKGIEISSLKLLSDVVQEILPKNKIAILSGPNFASEVAQNFKSCTTIASCCKDSRDSIAKLFQDSAINISLSDDVISPQVCGAMKNIIAIAYGFACARGCVQNTLAMLLNDGLRECYLLSKHFGGEMKSMLEPCAFGDLVLTCTADKSRNVALGLKLGAVFRSDFEDKKSLLKYMLSSNDELSEGFYTTKAVHSVIKENSLDVRDFKICNMTYKLLYEYKNAQMDSYLFA